MRYFQTTTLGEVWEGHFHSKKEKLERRKRWQAPSWFKVWECKFHSILRLKNNPPCFNALPSRPAESSMTAKGILPPLFLQPGPTHVALCRALPHELAVVSLSTEKGEEVGLPPGLWWEGVLHDLWTDSGVNLLFPPSLTHMFAAFLQSLLFSLFPLVPCFCWYNPLSDPAFYGDSGFKSCFTLEEAPFGLQAWAVETRVR